MAENDSENIPTQRKLDSCSDTTLITKLSYKQKKALVKKQKRKLKRQALAKQRDEELAKEEEKHKNSPTYVAKLTREAEEEEAERLRLEDESRRQHELWLWSEEVFMERLKQKQEQEERARQQRIETEKKIKEEWEERQRKEKEAEEERRKKKEKQEELLRQAREGENKEGAWHNPLAPVQYGKERQIETCPFFSKVGACRFGERCSRAHPYPDTSRTLLFAGMFKHFQLEQGLCEEYDMDIVLEYEDNEVYQKFREFYEDTLPEFKAIGKVVQFKVCCNYQPHLRGNVYVVYASETDAVAAFQKFNARWYGGKQMTAQLVNISSWKRAICGLFGKGRCPKGKECNFLHVFRNPSNEFSLADRDMEGFSASQNYDNRNHMPRHQHSRTSDRHRRYSRSPSRSSRRHRRSRSRSVESYRSYRSKRSKSRSRYSRSRSPEGHHRLRRSKRRSRSRSKYSKSRSRSRERSTRHRRSSSRSHSNDRSSRYRSRSRSKSKDRSSKRNRSKRHHSKSKDKPPKGGKDNIISMDTMNNYDESLFEVEWVEKKVDTGLSERKDKSVKNVETDNS